MVICNTESSKASGSHYIGGLAVGRAGAGGCGPVAREGSVMAPGHGHRKMGGMVM